ncbi:MAG: LysR family transcriptional regulator [Rhodobacteraceae bacterium]|nr:LysR family transcriptional regulator [Paracoccaceae bacterium]
MDALCAFDFAARHLNFRLAADEMHVTRGAVAQQVQGLEADPGHRLFARQARGLALTETGRLCHAPIRWALEVIECACAHALFPHPRLRLRVGAAARSLAMWPISGDEHGRAGGLAPLEIVMRLRHLGQGPGRGDMH